MLLGTANPWWLAGAQVVPITRGLGWLESVPAIAMRLALMAVAVLAARSSADLKIVIAVEVLLACVVPVLAV